MIDYPTYGHDKGFTDPKRNVPSTNGIKFLYKIYNELERPADLKEFSIHQNERDAEMEWAREFLEKKRAGKSVDGADALEAMLNVELDRSDWFGGVTFRTAQYDDAKGVDTVIEWDKKERFGFVPRLAVDIACSEDTTRIRGKLDKSINGVRVKYFRSQVELDVDPTGEQMTLEKLPIVILGIDADFAEGLGQFALRHKITKGTKEQLPVRIFAEHPMRLLLLEQALHQIDLQIQAEAERLERVLSLSPETPADERRVLFAYAELVKQPLIPPAQDVIKVLSPVTERLMRVHTDTLPIVRSRLRDDEAKFPPSPGQVLSRWLDLVAVRELIANKYNDTKKATGAAVAEKWRKESRTHALLLQPR